MVVVIEAGCLQPSGLRVRQHAERDAGLEPHRAHALDHGADLVEVAVLRLAPGRAHAEAAGAGILRGLRLGQHLVEAHQLFGLDAGVVFRALRAIGAVLRAAAGLDRQQRRDLHFGGIEIGAVDGLRAEDQVGKGQREQLADFGARPVMAQGAVVTGNAGGRHKFGDGHQETPGSPRSGKNFGFRQRLATGLGTLAIRQYTAV